MFTRLLAYTAARNFYKFSKQVFVTQQHVALRKVAAINTQYLHVKVYDKDAGLSTLREANRVKSQHEEDLYEEQTQASKVKPKRSIQKEKSAYSEVPLKSYDEKSVAAAAIVQDELNTDPDTFGNAPKNPLPEDEGDIVEEEYISRPTRRANQLRTIDYAHMIKDHLINRRIKEAIEVLEVRMKKEDRVKPESYIYNLLISGCAKAGYTRKCFQLFTKMRQSGLKVKESTYTSLFNACANAPSGMDGLTRARRLRERMLEKGYEANVVNYNAMIKAFGRWGDVETAYLLADEMVDKRMEMTRETYNFLLQACASDAELGFRHCLLTWHKMLAQGIQPDYYSFNAILRCVRDCGFGELESMEKVLNQILGGNRAIRLSPNKTKQISTGANENTIEVDKSPIAVTTSEDNNTSNSLQIQTDVTSLELPNLLAPQPHLGSMISLAEVQKPHERFLLLGGIQGFLEQMKSRNITPDIQTFTTMLEVIPPTNTAEKQVLMFIRKIGLKADIDFFNILIKKRAMRFDYEGGKEVLSMIRTAGLHPDIVTYGVLALGCNTAEASRELLQQMRQNNIRMNIQILGAMLRQGCANKLFPYICEIMQISLDENIKPNDIFLRHLHNFYIQCARAIDSRHPFTKNKLFKKQHTRFCDKYRLYQEEHKIDGLKLEDAIKKIKERPYQQYSEEPIDGLEDLKNEKLARKQKTRKYIKKIKLQTLKGDEEQEETIPLKEIPRIQPAINENNPFR